MLPDGPDPPPGATELRPYPTVPHHVPTDLLRPKLSTSGRNTEVLGTAVPVAPVDKHCETVPPDDDVRAPGQGTDVVADEAPENGAEDLTEDLLRPRAGAPDPRHYL